MYLPLSTPHGRALRISFKAHLESAQCFAGTRTYVTSGIHDRVGRISSKLVKRSRQSVSVRRRLNTLRICASQRPITQDLGDHGFDREGWERAITALATSMKAFYKFTRPHTMVGTVISIVSVSFLATQGLAWNDAATRGLAEALVGALLANISIVGLNQVFDVEIDKINKPYLPLASGEFSIATGIAIVVISAVLSLLTGVTSGSAPLFWTLTISLILGILYSTDLPFMRWKRWPVLAAGCILVVRALIVQLGFFYHMKLSLGTSQVTLTRPLVFTLVFMLFYSIVIALFKDIPDVKGDVRAGVRTFTVNYGVPIIFQSCIFLLLVAYFGGVIFGLTSPDPVSKAITCVGHITLGGICLYFSRRVDLTSKKALVDHYMFLWKLFYAEYLLIPFLA